MRAKITVRELVDRTVIVELGDEGDYLDAYLASAHMPTEVVVEVAVVEREIVVQEEIDEPVTLPDVKARQYEDDWTDEP